MPNFDEIGINNKLLGSFAEQIFELLHKELGCIVFKSGHENLYPNLIQLANKSRVQHTKGTFSQDFNFLSELAPDVDQKELKELFFNLKFKDPTIANLASNPDFTVITPKGEVYRFEVKYRWDGTFSTEELEKYKAYPEGLHIFVVTAMYPYMKILVLDCDIEKFKEVSHEIFLLKSIGDKAKGISNLQELKEVSDSMDIEMRIKFKLIAFARTLISHFEEVPYEKDGSMVITNSLLPSEKLMYPKNVLEKYRNIISHWLTAVRGN